MPRYSFPLWIIASLLLLGCGSDASYPPIDVEAAKSIKSGTPVAEIESLLGASHPATSTQAKQLQGVMSKMPDNIRANAEADTTIAWGDDSNFLVVKVNNEGIAWVTAWRSR